MSKTDELRERLNKLDAGEIQAPQGMTIQRFSGIEATIGQLKAAVKKNPEHPVAVDLKPMLAAYADKRHDPHKVTISRVDLEALLDNKEVKREIIGDTLVDGSVMTEVRKVLGDTIKSEAPAASSPEKSNKIK